MSDEATPSVRSSEPAEEKEPTRKADQEDPKRHGGGFSEGTEGSEAGGQPGDGRTGTGLGSTDS